MKSRVNSKLVTGLEKLVVLKQTPTTQIWSLLFASYLRLTGNIQNERPELSSQCRGTPLSDVLLGSGAILLHQNCQMNRITLLGFPLPGASQDGHDLSLWKEHNCIYLFLPSLSVFWGGPLQPKGVLISLAPPRPPRASVLSHSSTHLQGLLSLVSGFCDQAEPHLQNP